MDNRDSASDQIIGGWQVMDPKHLIETCENWTRWSFRSVVCCVALAGFGKARVICGRRTFEEQAKLYGMGRSADEMAAIGLGRGYSRPKDRRVTWLQPHESMHIQGRAIDVDFSEYSNESLASIDGICRQLGVTWGGVWSVRDYGHFEK